MNSVSVRRFPEFNEVLDGVYKKIRREELQQRQTQQPRKKSAVGPHNRARVYPAELIRAVHALHDLCHWSHDRIVDWVGDRANPVYIRRILSIGPSRGNIPSKDDIPFEAR